MTSTQPNHTPPPEPYTHVLRVLFVQENGQLRVASVTRVAMRVPAATTPPPHEGQIGSWFELRDANGALLYHRPLAHPVDADVEVFSDDPEAPIRRVPTQSRRTEFEVLLPDLPSGARFTLHGPTTRSTANATAARSSRAPSGVLASHDLAELRTMAAGGAR